MDETTRKPLDAPQAIAASAAAMPIDMITDRAQSTRSISTKHAQALMESVAVVGLIQPVVVNRNGVLLAGGHRLEALRMLKDKHPEAFDKLFPAGLIPVRFIEVDRGEDGERRALEIELTENEKRRDYTGKEIADIVKRLKQAGYKTAGAGARKKGDTQKHLTEAMALMLGKSRRQVQRLLSSTSAPEKTTKFEMAIRRCLKSIKQALEISATDDDPERTALALTEAVRRELSKLSASSTKGASTKRRHKAA